MMTDADDAMRTIVELPDTQVQALARFRRREGIKRRALLVSRNAKDFSIRRSGCAFALLVLNQSRPNNISAAELRNDLRRQRRGCPGEGSDIAA